MPLREPFFLKGRTSVVQRGVIMSAVLGGLAWLASLVTVRWHIFFDSIRFSSTRVDSLNVLSFLPIAITTFVVLPINYWNRRGVRQSLSAIPLAVISVAVFTTVVPSFYLPNVPLWKIAFGLQFSNATCSLALVRASRLHLIAWVASILGAAAPLHLAGLQRNGLSDFYGQYEWFIVQETELFVFIGAWLAAFAAPWGIPFWWPPEKDAGTICERSTNAMD